MQRSFLRVVPIFAIALMASACNTTSLEDALESISVVIELPPIETELSVQFIDATTGALIEQPIEVTFFGDQSQQYQPIDMYSDEVDIFKATSGFMNIGIPNGANVSESSPIIMGMSLKSQGYRDQVSSIEITSEGQNYFILEMVPVSNTPTGVSIINDVLPNSVTEGLLTEPISYSASELSGSITPRIGFDLPEGTVLKDADGTPLSGQLEVEVTIFNTSTPGATRFSNTTFLNRDQDSARIIYGLWETKLMDQSGRVATSMEIPASKRKGTCAGPFGTATVTSGCTKPIAGVANANAFDNPLFQNPLWWFGTPAPTPPSKIVLIEFEPLAQLPEWSRSTFGWMSDLNFEACVLGLSTVIADPYCYGSSPSNQHMVSQKTEEKNITVSLITNGRNGSLRVTLTSKGGYSSSKVVTSKVFNSDGIDVEFLKTHKPVTDEDYTIEVQILSDPSNTVKQFITREDYLANDIRVELPEVGGVITDVELQVALQCSNPDQNPTITDIPTASFYYQLAGFVIDEFLPWIPASEDIVFEVGEPVGFVTGGNVRLNDVIPDKTYSMKLVYDDEVIVRDVLITGPQVSYVEVLPDDICK